ncbi:hybrid sensor histidine kinase/response regulator [Bacteroides caccae]|nr:hybrid sensor histidine kinase/response regulator [Bacteroides caccae]
MIIRLKNLLTLLLLLLSFNQMIAQYDDTYVDKSYLKFNRLTEENGLSSTAVTSVFEDKDGFMWFGTEGGLNRYDGSEVKEFINHDVNFQYGLTSIRCFHQDDKGNIWMGSEQGLCYYDPVKDTFHKSIIQRNGQNVSSTVNSIAKYADNKICIGTSQGLFWQTDRSVENFNQSSSLLQNLSNENISSLLSDSQHNLWIGTLGKGLFRIHRQCFETGKVIAENVELDPNETSGHNGILCIAEYPSKEILVGTNNGLLAINQDGSISKMLDNIPVSSISVYPTGEIWCATRGEGLYFFKDIKSIGNSYRYGYSSTLARNYILSLYTDSKGFLWVILEKVGINWLPSNAQMFTNLSHTNNKNSLMHDIVKAVEEDKCGDLYFGTFGGLSVYNIKEQKFRNIEIDKNVSLKNNIETLSFDSNETLWIGTRNGLYSYSKDNNKITEIPLFKGLHIWEVFSCRDNSGLWIASFNGLYKYDFTSKTYRHFKFDNNMSSTLTANNILNVFEDSKNRVWIGTENGGLNLLYKEKKSGKEQIKHYLSDGSLHSLSNNIVNTIFESADGTIWVGTQNGLNRFNDTDETFRHYGKNDGLSSNIIKGITEDDKGNLWITTHQGITLLNPKSDKVQIFSSKDGIISNVFNLSACKYTLEGKVVVGGIAGATIISPEKLDNSLGHFPHTYISNLRINNVDINCGIDFNGRTITDSSVENIKQIELEYNENTISFDFGVIEYIHPEQIRFAYRIKNKGESWNYLPQNKRNVTFSNLDDNTYVLEFKSTDVNGNWSNETKEFKFIIYPHWSESGVAFTIYGIIVIFVIALIFRYSIKRVKIKQELLRERELHHQALQLEQYKLEFFTNISHEIRTPITLIAAPLQELKTHYKQLSSEQRTYYIELMYKNVQLLTKLIDQLLNFRKIERGKASFIPAKHNIIEQIESIVSNFRDLADKRNFTLDFRNENIGNDVVYDYDIIEKILYNLLSNAFKYTPEGGSILVEIYHKQGMYKISVIDTGIGIEKDKINSIFTRFTRLQSPYSNGAGMGIGLAYVKALVELHKGFIEVDSEVGKGSCFSFYFPDSLKPEKDDDVTYSSVLQPTIDNVSTVNISNSSLHSNEEEISSEKLTMLIVEDNSDLQTYLYQYFISDFNIITANNGKEALTMVYDKMPDMIITDVMMPEMDGLEFSTKVKNNLLSSHIPIIMLTAKSEKENEMEGLETGVDYYLKKPFDPQQLRVIVTNIIQSRKNFQKNLLEKLNGKPDELQKLESADEKFSRKVHEYIKNHISDSELSVERLASEMGMSSMHLYRKMKSLFGVTPNDYIKNIRLKYAAELLAEHKLTISEVAYEVGFNDPKYFGKCFKAAYGVSPSEYKK